MAQVYIHARFKDPLDPSQLNPQVEDIDFNYKIDERDSERIGTFWSELEARQKGVFSKPKGLGTLRHVDGLTTRFGLTDFKTYVAITGIAPEGGLNENVYQDMRVSALGALVVLENGKVFLQKRAEDASHVANTWDSSAAGLVHVVDGRLNFARALGEKLGRELDITAEEQRSVQVTGIHSCRHPDYSGMHSFKVVTSVAEEEMERRAGEKGFADYRILSQDEIPRFLIERFGEAGDMNGDGAAVCLSALDERTFQTTLEELRRKDKDIKLADLTNGRLREKI